MLLSILRDFNGNKFEARSFVGPCACDACKMEAFPILRCRDCDAEAGELHMDRVCDIALEIFVTLVEREFNAVETCMLRKGGKLSEEWECT